ncbi:MAG: cytochrome c [Candidatus Sulfotelmatobacter sp.]
MMGGKQISERNMIMPQVQGSTINRLLISFLVSATLLGSTELGFGQTGNSSGADIYKAHCVSCHAADGRGSAVGKSLHAADLHSPQVQQQTDAELTDVVKNGKANMPPFESSLSQDQIAAVVKYIRTFGKTK